QSRDQLGAGALRQRLAPGHADVARAVAFDLSENRGDRAPLPAMECIRGVAVTAAQRASREANEHGRPADAARLALEGMKYLGDAKLLPGRCDLANLDGHVALAALRAQPLQTLFSQPRGGRIRKLLDHGLQRTARVRPRSEEHTSELQSRENLVCRL